MNLFNWFGSTRRKRCQTISEEMIGRVMPTFCMDVGEVEPGLWAIAAQRRDTYRVNLYLWAQDEKICLNAACEISVERDLLPRELTLQLLEENHRCEEGSFRLVPQGDNRLVVLGRTIDSRSFPESKLRHLGETLIERMQRMVHKLHAMGLIISREESNQNQNKQH